MQLKENQIALSNRGWFSVWIDRHGKRCTPMDTSDAKKAAKQQGYKFVEKMKEDDVHYEIWEIPESEQLR